MSTSCVLNVVGISPTYVSSPRGDANVLRVAPSQHDLTFFFTCFVVIFVPRATTCTSLSYICVRAFSVFGHSQNRCFCVSLSPPHRGHVMSSMMLAPYLCRIIVEVGSAFAVVLIMKSAFLFLDLDCRDATVAGHTCSWFTNHLLTGTPFSALFVALSSTASYGLLVYMAGYRITPVLVFWTKRELHWEFLRLWTDFELPSSCVNLPCYASNRNRNILDFMRWPQIDLGAQDLNGIQRPKSFQKNSWK